MHTAKLSITEKSPGVAARPPLTAEEKQALKRAFADDGYFVVRNVVPSDRLAQLHRDVVNAFEEARRSGALFTGGGLMSGHLNCFPGAGSRFVYDALEECGLIDLIRELDPRIQRMPYVGCNLNLPGSVTQHYHTDRDFTREFLIANITLVDTNEENGATEMIPGTHKKYYPYWRFVMEGVARNSVRVSTQRGDVMVRSSNVWHRGMPNRTSEPRPMMALTWEDGGSVREDPFSVEDGRITFRPNWFHPTLLGRLRERLFVTVPFSYSALRFVHSFFGKKGY
ncbi:MAG: phytanoyl-CoA dioxygenase family protein [Chloroherpetonaceae bacterium]|nr:phytanoyl-CoA dioxygenase family protein [Chloroherpetonaceae bacterium]